MAPFQRRIQPYLACLRRFQVLKPRVDDHVWDFSALFLRRPRVASPEDVQVKARLLPRIVAGVHVVGAEVDIVLSPCRPALVAPGSATSTDRLVVGLRWIPEDVILKYKPYLPVRRVARDGSTMSNPSSTPLLPHLRGGEKDAPRRRPVLPCQSHPLSPRAPLTGGGGGTPSEIVFSQNKGETYTMPRGGEAVQACARGSSKQRVIG